MRSEFAEIFGKLILYPDGLLGHTINFLEVTLVEELVASLHKRKALGCNLWLLLVDGADYLGAVIQLYLQLWRFG